MVKQLRSTSAEFDRRTVPQGNLVVLREPLDRQRDEHKGFSVSEAIFKQRESLTVFASFADESKRARQGTNFLRTGLCRTWIRPVKMGSVSVGIGHNKRHSIVNWVEMEKFGGLASVWAAYRWVFVSEPGFLGYFQLN
jgi:hypothetical protein